MLVVRLIVCLAVVIAVGGKLLETKESQEAFSMHLSLELNGLKLEI